jgi:hypothetical protein
MWSPLEAFVVAQFFLPPAAACFYAGYLRRQAALCNLVVTKADSQEWLSD